MKRVWLFGCFLIVPVVLCAGTKRCLEEILEETHFTPRKRRAIRQQSDQISRCDAYVENIKMILENPDLSMEATVEQLQNIGFDITMDECLSTREKEQLTALIFAHLEEARARFYR